MQRCIEEEIVSLIKELYKMNISAEKEKIIKFLKSKKIWYDELIKRATKKQLKKTFPNLTKVMERIEAENIIDIL
ncbi:MAG: hypothetical protein FE041_01240 [Thermoplasmata archaeon]|nr:MAG: hypothetical protein FE041_01240 [Thermoplasmata archaeon]